MFIFSHDIEGWGTVRCHVFYSPDSGALSAFTREKGRRRWSRMEAKSRFDAGAVIVLGVELLALAEAGGYSSDFLCWMSRPPGGEEPARCLRLEGLLDANSWEKWRRMVPKAAEPHLLGDFYLLGLAQELGVRVPDRLWTSNI